MADQRRGGGRGVDDRRHLMAQARDRERGVARRYTGIPGEVLPRGVETVRMGPQPGPRLEPGDGRRFRRCRVDQSDQTQSKTVRSNSYAVSRESASPWQNRTAVVPGSSTTSTPITLPSPRSKPTRIPPRPRRTPTPRSIRLQTWCCGRDSAGLSELLIIRPGLSCTAAAIRGPHHACLGDASRRPPARATVYIATQASCTG